MTSAMNMPVLKECELVREKLRQIFLDVNHAYNYVYDHKENEALTALSVVIMEVVTVLQDVEHQKTLIDPFSFNQEHYGYLVHSPRERRSLSDPAKSGRRKGDRSSIRLE